MLKLIMKKDSIQMNMNLKESFTLRDRIKLIRDLCQLLEQEGALAESDEVKLVTEPQKPKSPPKSEELPEEPETYIECGYCHGKSPLGSETCSKCHGSFKIVGGRKVREYET